jgi:hypothetical protein
VLGDVASLPDGEGNLTLSTSLDRKRGRTSSHTPTLESKNTDPRTTAWLHERLGGSVDHPAAPARRARPHRKPLRRWPPHGTKVDLLLVLLVPVQPYLVTKRDRAETVLRFRAVVGEGLRPYGALSSREVAAREATELERNRLNREGSS